MTKNPLVPFNFGTFGCKHDCRITSEYRSEKTVLTAPDAVSCVSDVYWARRSAAARRLLGLGMSSSMSTAASALACAADFRHMKAFIL